jgi:tetratricopeptide (TPR) repeat protein
MSRLDQLKKLAAASPDDPLAHYAVGLEHFNLEQYEQAAAAFAQVLAVDANYAPAYYHKARAEFRADGRAAAVETLTAGIAVAQAAGDSKTVREMTELRDTIS